MDGRLDAFDDETQTGEVVAGDGTRYAFDFSQWRGRGLPRVGTAVRFDVREGRAVQVFDRPQAQQRATTTRDAAGRARGKKLSHWALAAFVIAVVGFSAGRYAPVVEIVALILAWVALRQVHRAPERLRGQALSAVAIVIAVGVTLWSQWP
ncbi:DUF4190 domain-containing protein [Salinicola halophilus]|uniref:DUF4190 domain-containing protein n=1 Tax=Salinicola halophilus TaxID=184065 RepID=UPI000DA1A914|nr:DUF4190 domain-containing protein [Salinicola halophilus]